MKDLLEYIAKNITKNEDIDVIEESIDGINTYTIKAPKEVMGMLIGKEGRTIRSIRTLAKARAIVEQTRIDVRLEEVA